MPAYFQDVIGSTKIKKKSVRIDVPPMAYVDSMSILSVKTRTERRGSPEVTVMTCPSEERMNNGSRGED